MNIAAEIRSLAATYPNLEEVATGGGCDFIVRHLHGRNERVDLVLSCLDDGSSPEKLTEPANVTLYFGEEWIRWVSFLFPTARAAIEWMALTGEVNGMELPDYQPTQVIDLRLQSAGRIPRFTTARKWADSMFMADLSYHIDDDPDDIIVIKTGAKAFTSEEVKALRHLMNTLTDHEREIILSRLVKLTGYSKPRRTRHE